MRNVPPRTIGILAGGGNLPIEIAASLKTRGAPLKVIAFKGEASPALDALKPTYVHWGQVGLIIRTLKAHDCRSLVVVGSVSRPDLSALKPDLGFFTAIPTIMRLIKAGGDDAVLRGVIEFFASKGITVVSPADIAPELIIGAGPYGNTVMPPNLADDVAIGFAAIRHLAPFDIGQSVIVTDSKIEAIEGADGTDAMLIRTSSRRRSNILPKNPHTPEGILIKRPKPGQDLRIDLPAIGPATAMRCVETNICGISVESGHVLALERAELKTFANAHKLFIEGSSDANQTKPSSIESKSLDPQDIRIIGSVHPNAQARKDAVLGGQLLGALERYDSRFFTIVSRGHVLTVDDTDYKIEAIARSAKLHQWGKQRRRLGVVILGAGRDADEQTIRAAADAGLACVAVRLVKFSATISTPVIEFANRQKIAIVEIFPGNGQ